MTCSPARLAANRANAAKSTGPRTEEGKARSRENSYKHGLTGAGVVLPAEDAEAVDARFAALLDDLKPDGEAARLLVGRVALLSVRLERSARQEAAALSARVLGAEAAFDDARKAEAEHLLRWIAAEPATNARRLMATPEGVELMIAEWERMKLDLENPHGTQWTYSHYQHADNLHGSVSGQIQASHYMAWTMALNGNYDHIILERLAGLDDQARRDLALSRLIELVAADLARLREHRATMDTRGVDAQRALAAEIALFDPSKEATLARKYEAATERGLFRSLRELKEIRKAAKAEPAAPRPPRGTLASFSPPSPAEPPPSSPADFQPAPAPDLATNEVALTIGRPRPGRE